MKVSVLIDSHGWIEYFADGPLAAKYAPHVEKANSTEYVTPVIVLYEVYKRLKALKNEEIALKAVAYIVEHTRIVQITKGIALNAADISLQAKIGMADAMIKAAAQERNAKIITGDEHFKGMPDVVFIG